MSGVLRITSTANGSITLNVGVSPLQVSELGDIGDVTLTGLAAGEIISWNGSSWVNAAAGGIASIDDIPDVTITAPVASQVLSWDGAAWVNSAAGGIASIGDITDVTITAPASNETLQWNGSAWVNVPIVAGDVASGTFADGRIAESSVTQHLTGYLQDITAESVGDLSDVTVTAPASNETLQWNGSAWVNVPIVAGDVASGTFADGRISESSVTQHLTGYLQNITGESIEDLSDVGTLSKSAGDALIWDGAEWTSAEAEPTILVIKGSAGTIAKGQPVYVSGFNVSEDVPEVEVADSSNLAKMPAIGLAYEAITDAATSRVLLSGKMTNIDTSPSGESWSVGDSIYVSDSVLAGGIDFLTNVKPIGNDAIQKVGIIGRVNPTSGYIVVTGAGRSNDVPNFSTADRYWYGGAGGIATEGVLSAFGRSLFDDADATAGRTTLGAAASSHSHAAADITSGEIASARLGDSYCYDTIQAMAWQPRVTNGAIRTELEAATNDIAMYTLAFDTAIEQGAGIWISLPDGWDAATVQLRFWFTAIAGTFSGSPTVKFDVAARSYADDESADQAMGTAQSVTYTIGAGGAAYDVFATAKLGTALTIAGAGDGELIYIELTRDVATDTFDDDVHLIAAKIEYIREVKHDTAWT